MIDDIGTMNINTGSGADTFNIVDAVTNFVANRDVTINSGAGNDKFVVGAVHTSLVLDAGTGDDRLELGSTGDRTMDGIMRDVTFDGQGDTNTVVISDQGSPAARVATLDATNGVGSITGFGSSVIRFSGTQALAVNGGAKGNTFTVANTLAN